MNAERSIRRYREFLTVLSTILSRLLGVGNSRIRPGVGGIAGIAKRATISRFVYELLLPFVLFWSYSMIFAIFVRTLRIGELSEVRIPSAE